jgi:bifunctional UDP-N-acetylglucosamine pyrophosphorylase/glucosamine-1-phosphate N-acetyltransferase
VAGPVVVILAAGQGTRMRSSVQKLLHPLCGRPIIGWTIAAARAAGAARIVIVDSPERPLAAFAEPGVELVIQPEANGTAGAVRVAAGRITAQDTVIVLNGDAPLVDPDTVRGLASAHGRSGSAGTIAVTTLEEPGAFGRVVRAPDGTVERVAEAKAPGDATELELRIREVNTGMFAFDGGPLREALELVRADNAQGELYLPDVLPILRAHGHTVDAFEVSGEAELRHVNDRRELAAAAAAAQRQICERHLLGGVTIVNPAATEIDVAVEIGRDTVIEPFSSLRGATRIGAGTRIGSGTTLIDATVGDGATVLHAHVHGARIGDRVSVGPFAYLRPGTVLREGSKAGTFVEIKNSDVGAGSKVPHLSYIGDTDIGEGTNLGAATITANYDGYRKHRTTIGSRVKTAVDTTLVAPVTIGDDAYTAAGSVIGQDVPPGALAGSPGVARSSQRTREGYAARRAEQAAAEAQTPPEETGERS